MASDLVAVLKGHLAAREAEVTLTAPRHTVVVHDPRGASHPVEHLPRAGVEAPAEAHLLRYRKVHTTRHTCATRMIGKKANLVYVQRQLDHASIKVTIDIYTHEIEEAERGNLLEVDRLCPLNEAVTPAVTVAWGPPKCWKL